jgi:DNA-binding winged helix-turn-helix (wHTH) protein
MKNNSMGDYYLLNNVRFSPEERTLFNDESGEILALTNISARCLLCFCERYEELISHDELIEFVWDVQHKRVQYNSLYQTLLILRRSLVQIGLSQEMIRTLPRKGFIMGGIHLERHSSEALPDIQHHDGTAERLAVMEAPAVQDEIVDDVPPLVMPQHIEAQIPEIAPGKAPGITLRLSIVTCLAMAVLSVLAMVGLWHIISPKSRNFFSGYEVVKDAPGAGICTWLYNSDATNFQRHRQFSADHPELCNAQEAIYVTAYDTSRKISAVACSNSLTTANRQAHCLSWYYPNRPTVKDSLQ